jgi:TDG/mug DNA glycosylase family protein
VAKRRQPAYEHLRLTDRIEPGVRVILVGINPGVMSALSGHHFAGPTNRFWGLLYEAGIVPEPVTHEDDVRLPQWGIGMTNLIARPSPGIDVLKPREYIEGWQVLERKIDRFRPHIVAFVGVTMYRALAKLLGHGKGVEVVPGFQHATVHGARIFVLPNPSGRNAHFSYDEMLGAFRELARAAKRLQPGRERASRASHASGAGPGAPASERAGNSEGRSPSDNVSERRRRGRRGASS